MQIKVIEGNKQYEISAKDTQTVLDAFREQGITSVAAPCNGQGKCKKCLVNVNGVECLACTTKVTEGMVVQIPEQQNVSISENGEGYVYPSDGIEGYAVACDIGTTTIVCYLLDMKTGERIGTVSKKNAQGVYGADVVSRIQAASSGRLRELQKLVVRQLEQMIIQLCQKAKVFLPIIYMSVAGNTVMCHLLAGVSPEKIGVAPFEPDELFGKEYSGAKLGFRICKKIYLFPCAAGYVGGDVTADLLATMKGHENEETLLLDIGTNGEMVLGTEQEYVCCAAAAGPAFEGAEIVMGMPATQKAISHVKLQQNKIKIEVIGNKQEAEGICGSGLLDAVAVFLQSGLMDETGMLLEADEVPEEFRGYTGLYKEENCVWLTEKVCVTQTDIRNIQLAKAAIAAGIQILLNEKGIIYKDVKRLILAGGFGTYLNKESAARIGLIPKELLPVTQAVGNAAGEGAISAAISKEAREQAKKIREHMYYIELSMHLEFSDAYMDLMYFE